jgi:uncharacterized damage-inducible protein DinB
MANGFDFRDAILNTWKTTNRTTVFLLEYIPKVLWNEKIPASPRRTVGMIARHIHNSRCSWIKAIGKDQTVKTLVPVDSYRADRAEVIGALNRISQAMLKLFRVSFDSGGKLPFRPAWLNFPNDIVHFLAYFVAHESHHRGQIILLARQLNHRLPAEVTNGVWQWTARLKEAR